MSSWGGPGPGSHTGHHTHRSGRRLGQVGRGCCGSGSCDAEALGSDRWHRRAEPLHVCSRSLSAGRGTDRSDTPVLLWGVAVERASRRCGSVLRRRPHPQRRNLGPCSTGSLLERNVDVTHRSTSHRGTAPNARRHLIGALRPRLKPRRGGSLRSTSAPPRPSSSRRRAGCASPVRAPSWRCQPTRTRRQRAARCPR